MKTEKIEEMDNRLVKDHPEELSKILAKYTRINGKYPYAEEEDEEVVADKRLAKDYPEEVKKIVAKYTRINTLDR